MGVAPFPYSMNFLALHVYLLKERPSLYSYGKPWSCGATKRKKANGFKKYRI